MAHGKGQEKRIGEAAENLRKIQKRIEPYVKKQASTYFSTAGKWRESSAWLNFQEPAGKNKTQ